MVRAWVKLTWNSLGAAVVAAAAQLGIADALDIVRWTDTYQASGDSGWSALLTWVAFIYAVAVLGGAATGRRAAQRAARLDATAARITPALAAGAGAAVAMIVAWLLSRGATPPVSVNPGLVVTLTAGAGVLAGVIIALLAMSAPPIAGGVRATVAWIWLVGIGSAVAGVASGDPYDVPRLAVVDAPSLIPVAWWSGPYAMIGIATILGLAVAAVARWGGAHRLGVALSGFAGPALVSAAYLIAGPGEGLAHTQQSEPYQASLIATGVGLVAGLLVAVPGRKESSTEARQADEHEIFGSRDRPAAHDRHDTYEQDETGTYGTETYDIHTNDAYAYGTATYDKGTREPGLYASHGSAAQYGSPDPLAADTAEQPVLGAPLRPQPTPAPSASSVMGQPPRSSHEEYADWLKDLGHGPGRDNT